MLDMRNHELVGVADFVGDADLRHLEWFGYDSQTLPPNDGGLSTVEVEDRFDHRYFQFSSILFL